MPPTVRDRTQELFATITSFQSIRKVPSPTRSSSGSSNGYTLSRASIEQSSRIHNTANQISRNIIENTQNIKELARLAKQTTNFHDERLQIQKLIACIKESVTEIDQNLKFLTIFVQESFANEKSKNPNIIQHHQQLLKVLQFRYTSLMKGFQFSCQLSSEFILEQKKEREKFGAKKQYRNVPRNRFANRSANNNNTNNNYDNNSLNNRANNVKNAPQTRIVKGRTTRLQQMRNRNRRNPNSADDESRALLPGNGNGDSRRNILNNRRQQLQSQSYLESDYYALRAEQSQKMESQLNDVINMVSQVAQYVDEQEHTIITINHNIQASVDNVEGAIVQLQKYLASLSGNRWLMIKVFALLIFFAVIFTIFVA